MGQLITTKRLSRAYEGLVASRCRPYYTLDTTNKQIMGRSAHIATEDLSAICVKFGTAQNQVADFGVSATTTLTASIEYPAGTFVQVTWSGLSSVVCSDRSITKSDYMSVSIPAGATFWIRMFAVSTGGVFYNTWRNSFLGEGVEIAASGLSDKTLSGTVGDSGNSFPPIGIIAFTLNPSAIIVGDSIAFGANDVEDTSASVTGYNGKVGIIARSMGNVPFLNISASTERATGFASQAFVRKQMIPNGSHLYSNFGTNDLSDSDTPTQVRTAIEAIFALARTGQKCLQGTIIPRVSVSGSTQTPILNETDRLALNAAIRSVSLAGQTGQCDLTSILESSFGSGQWGSLSNTADGTHCTSTGYALIQSSGIVPTPT